MNSEFYSTAVYFAEVPKLAWLLRRRAGWRLDISNVHRWSTVGVRGVRLAHVQIGGTRVTTHEALVRFFDQLTKANCADTGADDAEPGRRDRAVEQ
jgi:hypothetical protein